jgi:hypothetical protein
MYIVVGTYLLTLGASPEIILILLISLILSHCLTLVLCTSTSTVLGLVDIPLFRLAIHLYIPFVSYPFALKANFGIQNDIYVYSNSILSLIPLPIRLPIPLLRFDSRMS